MSFVVILIWVTSSMCLKMVSINLHRLKNLHRSGVKRHKLHISLEPTEYTTHPLWEPMLTRNSESRQEQFLGAPDIDHAFER